MRLVVFILRLLCQKIRQQFKTVRPVIIICVDHRKRRIDISACAHHSVGCSPRFDASLRDHGTFRHHIQFLECQNILNIRHLPLHALHDLFSEISFVFFFNDKYDFSEACAHGVIN